MCVQKAPMAVACMLPVELTFLDTVRRKSASRKVAHTHGN